MSVQSAPDTISKREQDKKARKVQQRLKQIATSWSRYLAFETPLRSRSDGYLEILYRLCRLISGEREVAKKLHGHIIGWDDARDKVLTIEKLEELSAQFRKKHTEIYSDIARVASHNSWIRGLSDRNEYYLLAMVKQGMATGRETSQPIIVTPATSTAPLHLTASEVNKLVARKNENFKKVDHEFRDDENTPKCPRTETFGFISDIDRVSGFSERAKKPRKPRKNWRKEVGI